MRDITSKISKVIYYLICGVSTACLLIHSVLYLLVLVNFVSFIPHYASVGGYFGFQLFIINMMAWSICRKRHLVKSRISFFLAIWGAIIHIVWYNAPFIF